jgi:hypothetical protein
VIRLIAAVLFGCLSVGAALVAASDYWIPIAVSLASAGASSLLVYPLWRDGRHRRLIAIVGLPFVVLSAHTAIRLVNLVASAAH